MNGNAAEFFVDRHIREGRGERIAFVDPWRSLSYAGLHDASARFAAALGRAGIGRERRLALVMLDTVDFPDRLLGRAARRRGAGAGQHAAAARPARLHPRRQPREALVVSAPLLPALLPILARAARSALRRRREPGRNAAGTVRAGGRSGSPTSSRAASRARDPVAASPDEVAFWLYSSGSTGAPKGARHLHGSLRATADTYGAQVLGIGPDDVMFSAAKLFFAYGLGNSMTFPMAVGAHGGAAAGPADAGRRARARCARYQPTIFCGVPTLYAATARRSRASAAAPARRGCAAASRPARRCRAHVGERWRARGRRATSWTASARTEMLHIFVSNRPGDVRYGTSGVPVPGLRGCASSTRRARTCADGESGELLVRGPSAAEGYWNQRAKSRRTFAGEWTRTGDTYVRDADGYYRYCGRADDMFKVERHLGLAVRGRGRAGVAPGGAGGRGGRPRGWRRADQAAGLRRAAAGCRPTAAARCTSSCKEHVKDAGRVRGNIRAGSRFSTPCRRPPPARSSASSCATRVSGWDEPARLDRRRRAAARDRMVGAAPRGGAQPGAAARGARLRGAVARFPRAPGGGDRARRVRLLPPRLRRAPIRAACRGR